MIVRLLIATALVTSCLFVIPATPAAQSDLDAFMQKVLARRDENWKKLQQYVLDEREAFRLTGPGGTPLYGFTRDYTWFIRQGFFVRSPLRADGVRISEEERVKYEASFLRREQAREKRVTEQAKAEGVSTATADATAEAPATVEDVLKQSAEPRFVSMAYFMKFKFEEGHYALAGRERLGEVDVLKIEYYPSLLFKEGRTRPNRELRERDNEIGEKMNKVSLVTLWIDPKQHQVVRYTFDNIDMDFLPGRSFVRLDEMKASMQMGQAFPDVWLPASIEMRFRMTLAIGSVDARYDVDYHDYRLAEVTTKIKG